MTDAARLTGLWIYPVKGAAPIAVEEWEIDELGLRYDRRWAVIDAAGDVLTQRSHPRLALVCPVITPTSLELRAPGMPPFELPLSRRDERRLPVQIWADRCAAEPCGAAADGWWTTYLGETCQLVRFPESTVRTVEPSRAQRDARVGFADAFPFLIISDAALGALNERLDTPVSMNRFRPNFVVSGVEAHAEDLWDTVRIGDVEFVAAKPCARCVVTTIDQATAIATREPLRTLTRYRREERGVMFGQNLVHRAPGTVRLGDAVLPIARVAQSV
ncbi:MAG: MOSC N-terminal beta barrel domain-containing protein [Gemmatimonadota bacterium]